MFATDQRNLIIFEGILLIILGLIAIAVPGIFTLSTELLFGVVLLAAGAYQLYRAIAERKQIIHGWWWVFLTAILNIIIGVLLLIHPLIGIFTLTILLIAYFIVSGVYQIGWGWGLRHQQGGWLIIFNGVLALLLAAIIFYALPGSAIWAIGLLLGINLLFSGIALLTFASALPKEPENRSPRI